MDGKRKKLLDLAELQINKPYVWGGNGPDVFDCSGLVWFLLKQAGYAGFENDHNCAHLWDKLKHIDEPKVGDLAFYGAGKNLITHVMIYWDKCGKMLGACGGNSDVTSVEIAKKKGARVRFRDTPFYRPDFLGFRKLPEK